MYNLKVDTHVHTIYSKHAFSTVAENVAHATRKGLSAIAITDHFGLLLPWFDNKREYECENHIKSARLPNAAYGVRVFNGIEIDIIGLDGQLAGYEIDCKGYMGYDRFLDYLLESKELVIASVHYFDGMKDGSIAENTRMYTNVLSKPKVAILGHPNRVELEFDFKEVVAAAKTYNKIIEINAETISSRPHLKNRCLKIAQECAEQGVMVCVGSDAHVCYNVGEFEPALALLSEIDFPPNLIVNRSLETFEAALIKARGLNEQI